MSETAPLFFFVELALRYTRVSCSPMGASLPIARTVQAADPDDALHQACLCLDRDLEQLLARVNTINVSEVIAELRTLRPVDASPGEGLWNPAPFAPEIPIPRHIQVRR